MFSQETTPNAITKGISAACRRVSSEEPVYLTIRPRQGARLHCCYQNVSAQVAEFGGSSVEGWLIWEGQGYLHLIHHSVWRSPSGEVIDVTPQEDGERAILFLPDPKTAWRGFLIAARYLHIDPVARELCELATACEAVAPGSLACPLPQARRPALAPTWPGLQGPLAPTDLADQHHLPRQRPKTPKERAAERRRRRRS